jgi:hypothetical protein
MGASGGQKISPASELVRRAEKIDEVENLRRADGSRERFIQCLGVKTRGCHDDEQLALVVVKARARSMVYCRCRNAEGLGRGKL